MMGSAKLRTWRTVEVSQVRSTFFQLCLSKSRFEDSALHFEVRNPRVSPRRTRDDALRTADIDRNSGQHRSVKGTGGAAGCSWDRRWATATLRCGCSGDADRRLLEWRRYDPLTAVGPG